MSALPSNFRNLIVIGASAGGLEAVIELIRPLPSDLPAAILVVQHIPAYSRSNLDRVLRANTSLRVEKAVDGAQLETGVIYVPRADRHLMVEQDRVVVSKGPRENRFRPAIDTLFRSAAQFYKERVVGIVVSGALNDGTSGMWTIKRFGGTAIVQDPEEAMFGDMPLGVMEYSEVDHVLPAAEMAAVVERLCRAEIVAAPAPQGVTDDKLLKIEIDIAKGKNGLTMGILDHGSPSPLACPECHGALTEFTEGPLLRFRCHTGHAHTAESLLASVRDNVEKSMWEVMRGMEESRILLQRLAEQLTNPEDQQRAETYRQRAMAVQQQAVEVQRSIERTDLSEDAIMFSSGTFTK